MTSFSKLTHQMLKQKVKYTYLVLVIQIIATFIFTVMNQAEYKREGFQNVLYNNSLLLTILFDVIFLAIMCWRNEKINLSQTWRQIPISNSRFYISNIMSTLLACAYLFIIQIILNMIISIPRIDRIFNDLVGLPDDIGGYNFFGRALTFVAFLVLIVVMVSTFVSFTNFLTRIIVDNLPVKNTLWAKMLVMGILIIIAAYIAAQINEHFTNFLMTHVVQNTMLKTNITEAGSLGVTDLEFLLISIVLGGLDLWFINRFIEAKIKK